MPKPALAAVAALLALLALVAPAQAAVFDGAPGQDTLDGSVPTSMTGGNWSAMPDGRNVRPYLKSLTVVNGADAQTVYEGGRGGQGSTQAGDVTAVVSPVNLCAAGQPEGQGSCYRTPNRVGVYLGYVQGNGGGVGRDFSRPSVPLRQTVTQDTVFDVVIGLNDLGRSLRWTWANGDLVDWKTSGLGAADGEVRIRIRPALTPEIDWSAHAPTGCTAVPVRDCDIDRADAEFLSANLVLSLDTTLPDALTGAVFATQRAIIGFLQPGGSTAEPVLDLQMASSHLSSDGALQRGTLQAFLPSGGLQALYGATPDAATTLFSATRIGDPGTSDAPEFTTRAEGPASSAGLLVTVRNITFSAPTYRLARKSAAGSPAGRPVGGEADGGDPTGGAAEAEVRFGKASRKKGLSLKVTGARPGFARATVLVGKRVVARGSARISAKGSATLRVRFSRSAQRKLKGVKKIRLRLALPGEPVQTGQLKLR